MSKVLLLLLSVTSLTIFASEDYDVSCSTDTFFSDMVIIPSSIKGQIDLDNFGESGKVGIEAVVIGNGNKRSFSGVIPYKKVGERIELQSSSSNSIKTTVTKDQFQEFFGPFPTINCSAT